MPSGEARSVANETATPPTIQSQATRFPARERVPGDDLTTSAARIDHSMIRSGKYTAKYRAATDCGETDPSAIAAATPNARPSSQRTAPNFSAPSTVLRCTSRYRPRYDHAQNATNLARA